MPPSTATPAATLSATSRARSRRTRSSEPRAARARQHRALDGVARGTPRRAARGEACSPRRAGKDSTTGHWEIAGVHLARTFSDLSEWFSARCRRIFEQRTGAASSATSSRAERSHRRSWRRAHARPASWILYTSADSVFQIAAHEDGRSARGALSRLRDRAGDARCRRTMFRA